MIKVAIVDDHQIVIEGIKILLDKHPDIVLEQTFNNLTDFYAELNPAINLVLLDINLPDGNGIDACKTIVQKYPNLKIIALTSFEESAFVKQILKNGALGYLLKNTDKKELTEAIDLVYKGFRYLPAPIQEMLLNDSLGKNSSKNLIPKLTSREKEVLELTSQEFTTEQIATKLFISNKTVESHKSNLFQKLGVKNSAGLVRVAFEKGLI
jgi:DNA-binding NarL/FixJ family response regulator